MIMERTKFSVIYEIEISWTGVLGVLYFPTDMREVSCTLPFLPSNNLFPLFLLFLLAYYSSLNISEFSFPKLLYIRCLSMKLSVVVQYAVRVKSPVFPLTPISHPNCVVYIVQKPIQ